MRVGPGTAVGLLAGGVDGLHEQLRRREVGEQLRAIVSAGERLGEIGADHVDGADLPQELEQLW